MLSIVCRQDSQPRGGVAVDHEAGLQSLVLLVEATSRNCGNDFSLSISLRSPLGEFLRVGIFDRILILRPAHAVFHRQVLHRLHEQRDPIHLRELRLQAGE